MVLKTLQVNTLVVGVDEILGQIHKINVDEILGQIRKINVDGILAQIREIKKLQKSQLVRKHPASIQESNDVCDVRAPY
jgi:hypothetical protein